MPERTIPVQTYRLEYHCDECGAQVEGTGRKHVAGFLGQAGGGTRHEHVCSACGHVHWLEREYPRWVHEPRPEAPGELT